MWRKKIALRGCGQRTPWYNIIVQEYEGEKNSKGVEIQKQLKETKEHPKMAAQMHISKLTAWPKPTKSLGRRVKELQSKERRQQPHLFKAGKGMIKSK